MSFLIFSVLVVLANILSDFLISIAPNSFLKIAIDSICHQLVSFMSWKIFLIACPFRQSPATRLSNFSLVSLKPSSIWLEENSTLLEGLLAWLLGGLIDIDHFISAKSFTLFGATHLTSRPVGHSVLCILLMPTLFSLTEWILFRVLRFPLSATLPVRVSLVMIVSFTSHQLRDASRRGLLLWSYHSTSPIPFYLDMVLLCVLPLLLGSIVSITLSSHATPSPPPSRSQMGFKSFPVVSVV